MDKVHIIYADHKVQSPNSFNSAKCHPLPNASLKAPYIMSTWCLLPLPSACINHGRHINIHLHIHLAVQHKGVPIIYHAGKGCRDKEGMPVVPPVGHRTQEDSDYVCDKVK